MQSDFHNVSHCLKNYSKIAQYESGNYLYVAPSGDLELQRVDQSSLLGSWSAAAGKTWTHLTDSKGVKADWRSVSQQISQLNSELRTIIESKDLDKIDKTQEASIKKLDLALQQSANALHKISLDYMKQSESRWTYNGDKRAASLQYEALAEDSFNLHQQLMKKIGGSENSSIDTVGGKPGIIDSEDSWVVLDEDKRLDGVEPLIKISRQADAIQDILERAPETISLDRLMQWKDQIQKELKDVEFPPIKLEQLSEIVQKQITDRQGKLKTLASDLQKAKSHTEILQTIGLMDTVLINEPQTKELFKTVLKAADYKYAELILADIDEKGSKDVPLASIKGAATLIHEQLKELMNECIAKDTFLAHRDRILELTNQIWLADQLIQRNEPAMGSLSFQSTLAHSYNQLIDEFIKEGDEKSAIACVEKLQKISIMEAHPLGDIARVVDRSKSSATWLEVGDSSIRRRNIRSQVRMIETNGNNKQYLCLTCTLGQKTREKLGDRIKFMMDSGLLDHQDVLIRTSQAIYQTFDRRDGVYKDTVTTTVGDAVIFQDSSRKITLTVGNDQEKWNQYQKVSIQAETGVTAQELYAFLSLVGLPTSMMQSRPEDVIQENTARLVQALHPGEVAGVPSSEETVRSVQGKAELKKIQKRAENMHLKDVGKGRMEYVDSSATKDFWLNGGRGFAATLGHDGVTFDINHILKEGFYKKQKIENTATTLGYILKGGLISTFERFEMGILGAGNAPEENIETGSANQVFTRPLTDNQFESKHDWRSYAIEGNILLLMDARLAERLPYGYPKDRAGLRNPLHHSKKTVRMAQKELPEKGLSGDLIKERKTLTEICQMQRTTDYTLPTAEVMFEDVIGPDYIYGAVVTDEKDKATVIHVLNGMGITNIQGVPLEKAIFVGQLDNSMIKDIYLR